MGEQAVCVCMYGCAQLAKLLHLLFCFNIRSTRLSVSFHAAVVVDEEIVKRDKYFNCAPLSPSFSVSLLYCLSTLCPALKPPVYEEVQQTPLTKLKIKDQEVDVTRYI